MFRIRLLLGLLAGLALPAHAQLPPGRASIPTRTALARLGLERQWSTVVPLSSVDDRVIRANLKDGTLFVQSSSGLLHAYDGESGRRLWTTRLVSGPGHSEPVGVNSDQVFAAAHDTLFCLDRGTGHHIWQTRLEAMPATGVVADEEVAAIGLSSGKLVAYNTRDHSKDNEPGRSAGTFAWAWQTQGALNATPLISPKVVAFGSDDHRVYTATRGDRTGPPKLLYRFLAGGPISAALAPAGNRTLIVPSQDFNIYAIDLFSGDLRWTAATGASITIPPLVSGTDIVILNDKGRLLILDARDGSIRTEAKTDANVILTMSPTRIYLATANNDIEIIDRTSGALISGARDTVERAGLAIRDLSVPVENVENDRIYLASPNGMIYCAREIDKVKPTILRNPSAEPFGTIPPDGFQTDKDESLAPPPPPAEADAPAEQPNPDDTPPPR